MKLGTIVIGLLAVVIGLVGFLAEHRFHAWEANACFCIYTLGILVVALAPVGVLLRKTTALNERLQRLEQNCK